MKVTVTDAVITIDGDADKARFPGETDDIMAQISEALGHRVGAVKLSGYWVIGSMDNPLLQLYPGHPHPTPTRKFTKALAEALSRTVVTKIPFK